jgi:hypothetical protein
MSGGPAIKKKSRRCARSARVRTGISHTSSIRKELNDHYRNIES